MDRVNPEISIERLKNATVALINEEKILQEHDIQVLESSIMPLIENSHGINLIMNFSNVKFLTSSALGLLIRISKKIYEVEGTLLLCCINPKIYQIFEITRLNEVFAIFESQELAIESL
ncbi:MAG: STAS domain-containing protein [Sedimentisphaerales bacterium]|nr:STAS domain-containing protein [Sedimentisphaerales bacterium]